jgi:hypothetical protein
VLRDAAGCAGSLLSMRITFDGIKKSLILRRLAKRGLEGRTTFFQPLGPYGVAERR